MWIILHSQSNPSLLFDGDNLLDIRVLSLSLTSLVLHLLYLMLLSMSSVLFMSFLSFN